MRCDKKSMRLYAVTDRTWVGRQTLYEQVESALKGGVTCIQFREKSRNEGDVLEEAIQIRKLCQTYHVPFIINDHVSLAIKCGADGIHVGQSDRPASEVRRLIGDEMILGVSTKTVEQALEAQAAGADYLGVGAVFNTTTKLDASVVAHDTLQAICQAVSIPVVAIGGISQENILELSGSGVDGIALVSAIFAAADIEATCSVLRGLSEKMVQEGLTKKEDIS